MLNNLFMINIVKSIHFKEGINLNCMLDSNDLQFHLLNHHNQKKILHFWQNNYILYYIYLHAAASCLNLENYLKILNNFCCCVVVTITIFYFLKKKKKKTTTTIRACVKVIITLTFHRCWDMDRGNVF